MTIAKVGGTATGVVSSGAQTSATTGSIDTTGADFLVVYVYQVHSGTTTVSDSKGNTWTGLTAISGANNGRSRIFYCTPTSVGSGHTFTVSNVSALIGGLAAMAFSGVAQSSPFDAENGGNSAGSASVSTGSVSPANADSLFVFGAGAHGPDTINGVSQGTIASNQIGVAAVNYGGGVAYLIQSGQSAVDITFSMNNSNTGLSAVIAAFKPASGAAVLVAKSRLLRQAVNRAGTY